MNRFDRLACTLNACMGLLLLSIAAPVVASAQSVELTSESYTLIAPTLSGGGAIDLQSTAPEPTVGATGVTIGQPIIGTSTGPETGIQLSAGFWHVVGGATIVEDVDTDGDTILDNEDNCPLHPNFDQADADTNGIGDVCECSGPFTAAGDATDNGRVDGGDYTIWADNFGAADVGHAGGDFNCDGIVNGADYTIWADNFDLEQQ